MYTNSECVINDDGGTRFSAISNRLYSQKFITFRRFRKLLAKLAYGNKHKTSDSAALFTIIFGILGNLEKND